MIYTRRAGVYDYDMVHDVYTCIVRIRDYARERIKIWTNFCCRFHPRAVVS